MSKLTEANNYFFGTENTNEVKKLFESGYNNKSVSSVKTLQDFIEYENLVYNPVTDSYDCDGSVTNLINFRHIIIKNGKFVIKFGEVKGSFDCSICGLKSLEGSPRVVGGSFSCSMNYLTSLIGGPEKVGSENDMLNGNYRCDKNRLRTLEGAPEIVYGNFSCPENGLISLKGAPKEVGAHFYCYYNNLKNLQYAPIKVGFEFNCHSNNLTSLRGTLKSADTIFCINNHIKSLKGCPQKIESLWCDNNDLESIEGIPRKLKSFGCIKNPYLVYDMEHFYSHLPATLERLEVDDDSDIDTDILNDFCPSVRII